MSYQRDFKTWDELEAHVRQMAESNATSQGLDVGYFSDLLFRGQANHDWALETTLERAKPQSKELAEYYRAVAIAKTQIETFTNRTWEDIDYLSLRQAFAEYDSLRFSNLPHYDFLVYLRHHGFPSPLLDWSRSFYVAAFFAFNSPKAERVSIFVYQEHRGSGKSSSSGSAQIRALGPHVRSHPRHFLQQGEYTLCGHHIEGSWRFAPHSDVFARHEESQDKLWKFTVPASESAKVIKRLDEYNINAFSLFQSEESLMATLAARAFSPQGL
ncbi:MAG: FRG domain-containing protein [Hylemonella sp.]|nr:FRG domain-containing protein [Hylemonella sp.]MDP1937145.1 FRG domain-containing protein [Hylemonella sp.]